MRLIRVLLTAGGLMAAFAAATHAAEAPAACTATETCGDVGRCGHCGRHGDCQKYCKLVCETKEIKKYVWVVKCDEICTMMPNCGCHACCCDKDHANTAPCTKCDCKKCDPCAGEARKEFIPPRCGKIREAKQLEKKEVVCKVPSYKCVVVYCCPQCGNNYGAPAESAPSPAAQPAPKKTPELPPPPQPGKSAEHRILKDALDLIR